VHNRVRAKGQITGGARRGQGGGVTAEITTKRATAITAPKKLAGPPAVDGLGGVSDPANSEVTPGVFFFQALLHVFLNAVEFHRRQELAVWQMGQAQRLAADPRKGFHIIVPGSQILIADGP